MSAQDFQALVNAAAPTPTVQSAGDFDVADSDLTAILDCLELHLDHKAATLAEATRLLAIATKTMVGHN